jgi:hypothetical protein
MRPCAPASAARGRKNRAAAAAARRRRLQPAHSFRGRDCRWRRAAAAARASPSCGQKWAILIDRVFTGQSAGVTGGRGGPRSIVGGIRRCQYQNWGSGWCTQARRQGQRAVSVQCAIGMGQAGRPAAESRHTAAHGRRRAAQAGRAREAALRTARAPSPRAARARAGCCTAAARAQRRRARRARSAPPRRPRTRRRRAGPRRQAYP